MIGHSIVEFERASVVCFTWMEWLWVGNLDNDVGMGSFSIMFCVNDLILLIVYERTESELFLCFMCMDLLSVGLLVNDV